MTSIPSRRHTPTFGRRIAQGLILASVYVTSWLAPADARREVLTENDKARLRQIDRINLDVLALTETGPADHAGIASAVAARLKSVGYQVGQDPTQAQDAVLKVKCEEHKTWEGTARSGGDADAPGASSRLWRGPACQFSYRLEGLRSDWRYEVRAALLENPKAGGNAPAADSGAAALALLADRLTTDAFPFLLAAEWGQSARLLAVLDKPETDAAARAKIIGLLGGMFATDAMPALATSLQDQDIDVAKAAAVAIGTIGHEDGIPLLLDVFKNGRPELHQAAAQGLGRLAALHPRPISYRPSWIACRARRCPCKRRSSARWQRPQTADLSTHCRS